MWVLVGVAEERAPGNFGTDDAHAQLHTLLLQLATSVDTETWKILEVCSRGRKFTSGSQVHAHACTLDQFLSVLNMHSIGKRSSQLRSFYGCKNYISGQRSTESTGRTPMQVEQKCAQRCGALLRLSLKLSIMDCGQISVEENEHRELRVIVVILSKQRNVPMNIVRRIIAIEPDLYFRTIATLL
jgi:hypothetical protein